MQKLWIVTELFYPEETSTSFILTKIANRLIEKYDIEVVCGEPVYDTNSTNVNESFTLNQKIKVKRLKSITGSKNNLFSRTIRYIILSCKFFFVLLSKTKKNEKVFIVTNPAPLILLIALLKKIKNFELIILVHDVFPENTIPAGILKSQHSLVYKLLKYLFDRAYATASRLIVLGRDMRNVIEKKILPYNRNARITVIENWGDAKNILPLNKSEVLDPTSPLLEKIVFQYAGNLGRVQALMELLAVIKNVNNESIVFQFIGEGAIKESMIDYVQQYKLNNVHFGNAYKRNEQSKILNNGDIAIITLSEGMYGLGVPSKTYNVLMAGKPILFIGELQSEIGLLLKETGVGYCFENNEQESLLKFFNSIDKNMLPKLKKMGEIAREIASHHYSEEAILEKFNQLV